MNNQRCSTAVTARAQDPTLKPALHAAPSGGRKPTVHSGIPGTA